MDTCNGFLYFRSLRQQPCMSLPVRMSFVSSKQPCCGEQRV